VKRNSSAAKKSCVTLWGSEEEKRKAQKTRCFSRTQSKHSNTPNQILILFWRNLKHVPGIERKVYLPPWWAESSEQESLEEASSPLSFVLVRESNSERNIPWNSLGFISWGERKIYSSLGVRARVCVCVCVTRGNNIFLQLLLPKMLIEKQSFLWESPSVKTTSLTSVSVSSRWLPSHWKCGRLCFDRRVFIYLSIYLYACYSHN